MADLLRRALARPGGDEAQRGRLLSLLALEGQNTLDPSERDALTNESLAIARRGGDPADVANALIACQWVAMHPAAIAERFQLADQLVAIARDHGLAFAHCMGQIFRFMGSLELGDAPAAIAALDAAARTPGHAAGHWIIAYYRTAWTLATGRLEQAEQDAAAAFAVGQDASVDRSLLFSGFTGQIATIRILQGRLTELEGPLVELVASQPFLPSWQAALAKLRCDQGRLDEARDGFAAAMAMPAIRSPRHDQWSTTLCLLAEVATALGDRSAATELFQLLRPFAGLMTWNIACTVGPFDLALGRLADVMENRAEAERRLQAAIALCERMGAEAFLAIARHELAPMMHPTEGRRLAEAARAVAARLGVALASH